MDYIPPVEIHASYEVNFQKSADLAQYKGSDYSNVVRVARNISLKKAFEIASSDENVDYFMYVKGYSMVLEVPPEVEFDPVNDPFGLVTTSRFKYDSGDSATGLCRIFNRGDTVFFKQDGMWLGTAPGLADVYVKQ